MRSVLKRNRALIILGIAESVSGVGSWITALAVLALVVFHGAGGAAQSSGIMLAGLGPALVCGPLAGWLADHFDRKRLMIASELLSGLAVVGLMLAPGLEWLYLLLAAQAVAGSLLSPARQAAVPGLVAPDQLPKANAFLQQLAGSVKIGAPILAGALLTVLSPRQAMLLDVVSFVLSAAILSRLPALRPPATPQPAADTRQGGAPPAALTVGAALRDSSRLRLLFLATFLLIITIMSFDVLAPVFTRDVLRGNEGVFGLLVGLVGLGTVAATGGLLLRKGQRDPWRDLLLGLGLLGCIPFALMLAAWAPAPLVAQILAGAGCLIGGVGNGLLSVQASTLLQRLTPPALLGRMSGTFQSTVVAGQLLAIFLTPLLVPALVPVGAFFGAAALAVGLLALGTAFTLQQTGGYVLRET